ncbi:uncharacterized protein BDR25DRAFT_395261 [Lindgomyces ingoldianus]|uniref:Uncharacterized protein n=1 Tax=Lindgomyces ingoldianus TaxID=673940 RepID=A0ACB6QLU9_9PLEO|nr:uncharacterized protein BDR25DRAFT_395261 [Lindgomyces ingoldianus]KAF2467500.1 hypothetical protein BDR25DRAFT_395261 [Lindgomyces ingoldianus]
MKAFASIAAFAAFSSAVHGATVTLKETACITRTQLEEFTIEVDKLVVKQLDTVCGLQIISADGVDVNSLSCLAYKDAEGTDRGSAVFTFATPALISTNPVQEGSIRCNSTGGPENKANSSTTMSTLSTAVASTGTALPISTGNVTVPTGTRTPTPSSGPSATGSSSPAQSTGAAAHVGLSVGAAVGAFAVFFL